MKEPLSRKNEAILMAGVMAMFFLAATIHATIAVMLPYYIAEYQLSLPEQGYFGTAESVGFLISLYVMAEMMRRLSRKKLLLGMAFVLAMSLIMIGLKPSVFLLLLLCYTLFGISYGIIDSLSSSLISDLFPGHSGKKMSYMRAVYCLGGMTSPLFLNALLKAGILWNRVILITGGIGLAAACYYCFFSTPRIPNNIETAVNRITFQTFREFIALPGAIRVILFGMLFYGHQIGLTIWIVRYITHFLNEPTWGYYALTFYWVGALISRVFVPQFVKEHRPMLLYGSLGAGLFLSIGILSGFGWLMAVMVLLAGLSEGTTVPMMVDYACSLDRSKSAMACSSLVFFNNISSMFIPSVIGAMIGASGAKFGFMILPLTSFICAAVAIGMKGEKR